MKRKAEDVEQLVNGWISEIAKKHKARAEAFLLYREGREPISANARKIQAALRIKLKQEHRLTDGIWLLYPKTLKPPKHEKPKETQEEKESRLSNLLTAARAGDEAAFKMLLFDKDNWALINAGAKRGLRKAGYYDAVDPSEYIDIAKSIVLGTLPAFNNKGQLEDKLGPSVYRKIHKAIGKYDRAEGASFATWAGDIAANAAFNYARDRWVALSDNRHDFYKTATFSTLDAYARDHKEESGDQGVATEESIASGQWGNRDPWGDRERWDSRDPAEIVAEQRWRWDGKIATGFYLGAQGDWCAYWNQSHVQELSRPQPGADFEGRAPDREKCLHGLAAIVGFEQGSTPDAGYGKQITICEICNSHSDFLPLPTDKPEGNFPRSFVAVRFATYPAPNVDDILRICETTRHGVNGVPLPPCDDDDENAWKKQSPDFIKKWGLEDSCPYRYSYTSLKSEGPHGWQKNRVLPGVEDDRRFAERTWFTVCEVLQLWERAGDERLEYVKEIKKRWGNPDDKTPVWLIARILESERRNRLHVKDGWKTLPRALGGDDVRRWTLEAVALLPDVQRQVFEMRQHGTKTELIAEALNLKRHKVWKVKYQTKWDDKFGRWVRKNRSEGLAVEAVLMVRRYILAKRPEWEAQLELGGESLKIRRSGIPPLPDNWWRK